MALNKTIDLQIANKNPLDFFDVKRNFTSCIGDHKEGIIESCSTLGKLDDVSQKMYLAVSETNKFVLTKLNMDNKDASFYSSDDIDYITGDQHAHSTTQTKEIFLKAAAVDTTSQQFFNEFKNDQRTNESDYCVIQDDNNATIFHVQLMPPDQNMSRLRHWNSTIFYYGPEVKHCSILLTDYRIQYLKPNPLETAELFIRQPISGKPKSNILLQKMYTAVAHLANDSDDSDNEEKNATKVQLSESYDQREEYSIGDQPATEMEGNSLSDAMTVDAFNNWQQFFPLWSDYDHCSSEAYEVIQDPNNPLLFHVRAKTTENLMVSDQITIRHVHQSSIFYYGPELKSCFVPLRDYRIRRRRPNPLENMEFFAVKPKKPKARRSKKGKSRL